MKHTELARNGTRNRRGIWKWLGLSLRGRSPWQSRFLVFLVSIFPYFHISCLSAQDIKAKLNSADGSTSFQVRDSGDVVVATITSKGYALFASSVDVKGDLRVQDNEIFFGATQIDRKIYDDSTNYATAVSSHLYVTGSMRSPTT